MKPACFIAFHHAKPPSIMLRVLPLAPGPGGWSSFVPCVYQPPHRPQHDQCSGSALGWYIARSLSVATQGTTAILEYNSFHQSTIASGTVVGMFIKVSTLFAAIAALASTTASSLVTRSCSGKTPYVILRVDEWMHIDVLDKDPHQPLQQWGDWGVFTKSFNFSTHDQYYREHFVATSYVENGVWDRENPDNLVEKAKFDVSDRGSSPS